MYQTLVLMVFLSTMTSSSALTNSNYLSDNLVSGKFNNLQESYLLENQLGNMNDPGTFLPVALGLKIAPSEDNARNENYQKKITISLTPPIYSNKPAANKINSDNSISVPESTPQQTLTQ